MPTGYAVGRPGRIATRAHARRSPRRAARAALRRAAARRARASIQASWVVGGAVRDALLGRPLGELDVVVDGDPEPVAAALGEVVAFHERFGTYDVRRRRLLLRRGDGARRALRGAGRAARRRAPATLEDDLLRRDFTVNALALNAAGELHAAPRALEDLEAGRLRVLHAASFRDDPTRLWRLVRYAVRLGFAPEPATDRLACEAVQRGALETVSGDRLGAELRLALIEPDPLAALHAAQNLGLVEV